MYIFWKNLLQLPPILSSFLKTHKYKNRLSDRQNPEKMDDM